MQSKVEEDQPSPLSALRQKQQRVILQEQVPMCCHSQADWKIRIITFHWNNLRLFPTLQKLFSTRNPAASGATVAESRPRLCFCSHFTQCGQQMTRIKKNCAWLLSLLKPPPALGRRCQINSQWWRVRADRSSSINR